MYRVIKDFADANDNLYVYKVGDVYPRDGVKTSLNRALELMGEDNKIGEPLIAEIVDKPKKSKKKK